MPMFLMHKEKRFMTAGGAARYSELQVMNTIFHKRMANSDFIIVW